MARLAPSKGFGRTLVARRAGDLGRVAQRSVGGSPARRPQRVEVFLVELANHLDAVPGDDALGRALGHCPNSRGVCWREKVQLTPRAFDIAIISE